MKHATIRRKSGVLVLTASIILSLVSCNGDDDSRIPTQSKSITVENILDSKPLVQSGAFRGNGNTPVILPGQSVSFSFYAGLGQALTFATMYGWSNDLFFASENHGIKLCNDAGIPITGDVSSQIKLWDNGTRINQTFCKIYTIFSKKG